MTNPLMPKRVLSAEEIGLQKQIHETYNSGKVGESWALAEDFYRCHPESLYAKFVYAAMCGDYSQDTALAANRQKELMDTAKTLIKEVYSDETSPQYEFYGHAQNEYFWFHELHEDQYALGTKLVGEGNPRGYYYMCVAASTIAKKGLLEGKERQNCQIWAEKAVKAFREFKKIDPDWHSADYFYAYALAILGKYSESLETFTMMCQKQETQNNENERSKFLADLEMIKKRLGSETKAGNE